MTTYSYERIINPVGLGQTDLNSKNALELLLLEKLRMYPFSKSRPARLNEIDYFKSLASFATCDSAISCIKRWKPTKDSQLNSNILNFLLSIQGYDDGTIKYPKLPELLRNMVDSEYASKLKKFRLDCFLYTFNGEYIIGNVSEETPHIFDIGEVFNYQWLPWIDQGDDFEFFKNSFIPLEKVDKNMFRKYTRRFFESFDFSDFKFSINDHKNEILMNFKNTYCNQGLIWEARGLNPIRNVFSERRGPCRRKVINVASGNTRDTVINSLEDLNTINLIERFTFSVLNHIKANTFLRSERQFNKKYSKFKNSFNYFYCRDFKKEGHTRPRYLVKAILKELKKVTGVNIPESFFDYYEVNFDIFETPFFNNLTEEESDSFLKGFCLETGVDLKSKTFKPPRGTGLGMCNSIVTLMQFIVHSIIIDYMEDNGEFEEGLDNDIFALNDDVIMGFESKEVLDTYIVSENMIFDRLGLLRKDEKSFSGFKGGVFLERYFNLDRQYMNDKKSFNSKNNKILYKFANPLERAINFNSYDLHPLQKKLPRSFGGFMDGFDKCDLFLSDLSSENFNVLNALNKVKIPRKRPIKIKKGRYINPIDKLFPDLNSKLNDEERSKLNLLSYEELQHKYAKFINPENERKWYDRKYQDRLNKFHKYLCEEPEIRVDLESRLEQELLPTGEYLIPYKFPTIELEFISLADLSGEIFRSETPLLDFIRYKLTGDGNPVSFIFDKGIDYRKLFEDPIENSFPIPRNESDYEAFFGTYGNFDNARKQYEYTLGCPVLPENLRNPIYKSYAAIMNRNIVDFLSYYGPVRDIRMLNLIRGVSQETFDFIKENLTKHLNVEFVSENKDIAEEAHRIYADLLSGLNIQNEPNDHVAAVLDDLVREDTLSSGDDHEGFTLDETLNDSEKLQSYKDYYGEDSILNIAVFSGLTDEFGNIINDEELLITLSWLNYLSLKKERLRGNINLPENYVEERSYQELVESLTDGISMGWSFDALKVLAAYNIIKGSGLSYNEISGKKTERQVNKISINLICWGWNKDDLIKEIIDVASVLDFDVDDIDEIPQEFDIDNLNFDEL